MGFGPECLVAVRSNYAGIAKLLAERDMRADFVFADLGCSSMQFDDPSRGFSFKHDGPLDMRMNPTRGLSASDWLARTDAAKLEGVLRENADEPNASLIAIELAGRKFLTTAQLANAIQSIFGIREDEKDLSLRRVFQAIRIAVNEEFTALDAFLRSLSDCLKPGGRVAILTFHSGEDRRVKKCFQAGLREGVFSEISNGVITASAEERRMNPRSSSAKLRWAVRTMA
jgi:16S rRNA (cytosine1402-N4)-methyltransferase